MTIRPHTLEDGTAIADILAEGWATAYSSFMPASILSPRVDKAHRRQEVKEWLEVDFDPTTEYLLVWDEGGVDGFVHIVLEDKAELGAEAHISLLYVRPALFGQGMGRALLAAAADWLASRTTGPIVLAAYANNPYRTFYNHMGGRAVKSAIVDFDGHKLESIYYHWDSAEALRTAAAR